MALSRQYRFPGALAAVPLLMLVARPSLADNWQPLGEVQGATRGLVYINIDSVRDEGGYRVATFLTILATGETNAHDIKLDRFAEETAFDCAKHTFSPLSTVGYLDGRKVGTRFDKGDWRSSFKGVPADSIAQGAFTLTCRSPVTAHPDGGTPPAGGAPSSDSPATVALPGPATESPSSP